MEEIDWAEMCFYENEIDSMEISRQGTEYRCEGFVPRDKVVIKSLGRLFDNRTTTINLIEFHHDNIGSAIFSNFNFASDPEMRKIGSQSCEERDPNAIEGTAGDASNVDCFCGDGFVASNGGKLLNPLDSCVSCLMCAFAGDFCVTDRDCMMESCV
eukprot:316251_1